MLILPLENRLDWRHPPFVTLTIVLINAFVFFSLLGPDQDAIEQAWQVYNSSDLVEVDATAYRDYWDAREHEAERGELPADDRELVAYIFWDLEFDSWLRENPPAEATASWRRDRDRFEARRADSSSIGYGLIPAEVSAVTMFTSMYLHGGVWHLVGNMVFLFLFGFSLERSVGRFNYVVLYHLTGLVSAGLTVLVQPDSHTPTIGASGAVSGLMGAYIGVYRLRKIRFFYNVLVYFGEFRAPALWVFPFWLAKELYGQYFGDQGVAYWAHIGGLLGGVACGVGLSLTRRGVDQGYLDTHAREEAQKSQRARLDALVDEFKYDQASALVERLLEENPADPGLWTTYLGFLRTDTAQVEYHQKVMQLLGLASQGVRDAELGELIEQTYRTYVDASHPKPVLKNTGLLKRLGVAFVRSGRLEAAQDVAERLLQGGNRDEDVGKLLNALANGLQRAGEDAQATRYRRIVGRLGGEGSVVSSG